MSRVITMTVSDGNNQTTIRDVLASDSTWMAQAYLFHKFLLAQGFVLEADQVGSDVAAYVNSQCDEEESW